VEGRRRGWKKMRIALAERSTFWCDDPAFRSWSLTESLHFPHNLLVCWRFNILKLIAALLDHLYSVPHTAAFL
jgi:hypothetical protein